MGSGSVDKVIESILGACGIENVKAIILYGSAARGVARETSDIDLLVLVEKPCSPALEPPYSIIVNTIDEWSRLENEFRMEILRDGIILYTRGLAIRRMLNGRPWLLIRYSGENPGIRQCIKNSLKRLYRKMPIEKIAPGVILTPYGIVSSKVIETILSCKGDIDTRFIVYRQVDVHYAVCPYCGYTIAGYKEYVKREMKKHLLTTHRDRLQEIIDRLVLEKKGIPGGNINGVAGWLTSYLIHIE
ncbi:MAG: hypothetical protein DRO40_05460 [Thermoprotei archaeon]|nr:MAG: hypothetical protein DRO40_05460 [Thermoprotei archaeon]